MKIEKNDYQIEWTEDFSLAYTSSNKLVIFPFDLGGKKGTLVLGKTPTEKENASEEDVELARRQIKSYLLELGYEVI